MIVTTCMEYANFSGKTYWKLLGTCLKYLTLNQLREPVTQYYIHGVESDGNILKQVEHISDKNRPSIHTLISIIVIDVFQLEIKATNLTENMLTTAKMSSSISAHYEEL